MSQFRVRDYWNLCIQENCPYLASMYEYLVFEAKQATLDDSIEVIDPWFQPKYHKALQKRVLRYMEQHHPVEYAAHLEQREQKEEKNNGEKISR